MKFSKVYSYIFALLLAVKLLNVCLCDQVNNFGSGLNSKTHGNPNAHSSNVPGSSSKTPATPSTPSAPTTPTTPSTPAAPAAPVVPSLPDEADKAIDKVDEQIEKKRNKKKICMISAAATALTLLLGSALGFGFYKYNKKGKGEPSHNGQDDTGKSETTTAEPAAPEAPEAS
ncbi:Malarial early transcribed membrane protein (ETRAMP), putative [Plasmodium ovale]|uniref:Malarial early transcribed membrane protein (ETRAMP), putative n=1 Tax=Plasmodium ovale TaxID=36330 RepID=A0A1C3KI76_PLAOA|nr:Malarial early transcribed membrane protein (ETRAMP), putative [Plasmodium ovale]